MPPPVRLFRFRFEGMDERHRAGRRVDAVSIRSGSETAVQPACLALPASRPRRGWPSGKAGESDKRYGRGVMRFTIFANNAMIE
jgi:hypothetical protein